MTRPSFAPLRFFAGLLLVASAALAADRTWTSTAGTRLEAEYVATVNRQHWLRTAEGRLLKVAADQLSAEDRAWLNKQPQVTPGLVFPNEGAPVLDISDPDAIMVLETLATLKISSFQVNRLELQAALDQLSDSLVEADPTRRRIRFLVTDDVGERSVSMSLRNLNGLRILQILCGSGHPMPLSAQFVSGDVVIGKHLPAERRVESPSQPSPGAARPPAVATSPERRAGVSSPQLPNLLFAADFEASSSRWVFTNRKRSFQRVPSTEASVISLAPDLGSTVMRLKPTPKDDNLNDGPPFLTQKFRVGGKARRLLVSCDVAYVGPPLPYGSVRLSIVDPELRYFAGSGLEFPFVQVPFKKAGAWQHMEWEADVSDIKNREMQVGFMFPFSEGTWYIDNARVSRLPDAP